MKIFSASLVLAVALLLQGFGNMQRLDAEACRQLVERGRILSLFELVDRVYSLSGSHMVEAVLLQQGERYIYELEVATKQGVMHTLYVDARTGELLDL